MTNEISNNQSSKAYDLEERTARFAEAVIEFATTLPKSVINSPLVSQLVRAASSIGANYCEADCAESKKDFEHKMGISRKESKETKHWVRLVAKANPHMKEEARKLYREANELNLIFSSIVSKSKKKD